MRENVYANLPNEPRFNPEQRGISSRNEKKQQTQVTEPLSLMSDKKHQMAHSNSPAMRSSYLKINPQVNSNIQHNNNFTGINIRRQGPSSSV